MQLRESDKEIRVVEFVEFSKLLDAASTPAFRALIVTAFHQGMRRAELCQLRWSEVDLDRNAIHVINDLDSGRFTKNRKNRVVPLHPATNAALAALFREVPKAVCDGREVPSCPNVFCHPDGKPFLKGWASVEFGRTMKRTGIPRCTLHDLRRSFSTLAQRAGVDTMTVVQLGGWSCASVVQRHYTGEIPTVLEGAMVRIAAAQTVG